MIFSDYRKFYWMLNFVHNINYLSLIIYRFKKYSYFQHSYFIAYAHKIDGSIKEATVLNWVFRSIDWPKKRASMIILAVYSQSQISIGMDQALQMHTTSKTYMWLRSCTWYLYYQLLNMIHKYCKVKFNSEAVKTDCFKKRIFWIASHVIKLNNLNYPNSMACWKKVACCSTMNYLINFKDL